MDSKLQDLIIADNATGGLFAFPHNLKEEILK
jgi:hypothetical protein